MKTIFYIYKKLAQETIVRLVNYFLVSIDLALKSNKNCGFLFSIIDYIAHTILQTFNLKVWHPAMCDQTSLPCLLATTASFIKITVLNTQARFQLLIHNILTWKHLKLRFQQTSVVLSWLKFKNATCKSISLLPFQ